MNVSQHVIWVRGTDEGTVQLFIASGFRDAFTRPQEMRAPELGAWLDSAAALGARSSTSRELVLRTDKLSDGLVLERRIGGDTPGLSIQLADGDQLRMPELAAQELVGLLSAAVSASRELTPALAATSQTASRPPAAPRSVDATPAPAERSTPMIVGETVPASTSEPSSATSGESSRDSAQHAAPVKARESGAQRGSSTTSAQLTARHTEQSEVPSRAEVTTAAPRARAASVVSATSSVPSPEAPPGTPPDAPRLSPPEPPPAARAVVVAPAPPPPRSAVPTASPPKAIDSDHPRPETASSRASVAAPPDSEAQVSVPSVSPRPAPAVRPPREALTADKRVSTPLGSFVVPHAVLADHDAEIRYCYTQLGLKYDHDLHGTLTLRLEVDSDGGIRDVVITQRSWQGITAGEVEACVRALVRDWTLPHGDPAISAGSKELTLTFAP